jgi:hypothetical protein
MVTLSSAPINALTWTWGAISLYVFVFKSFFTYKRTKNPLARIYTWLSLIFGTGLLFFGLPGLLTQNPHILHYTYFVADGFIQLSMQLGIWLIWFLGLRTYVKLRYLLAMSVPFSLVLLTTEVLTSNVTLSKSPNLIVYTDHFPVLLMKSIIYIAVAIPIGFFLLRQVPHQTTLSSKLKSLVAGLMFIIVCIAAVSNNIFDKGSDTVQSATELAIFFTIFLLAQLSRRASRH